MVHHGVPGLRPTASTRGETLRKYVTKANARTAAIKPAHLGDTEDSVSPFRSKADNEMK